MTKNAHLFAALVTLTALVAISIQFIVSLEQLGNVGSVIWVLVGFFTVLTNLLVLITFAQMTITGRYLSPFWLGGLTLWISIVGVVYHTLLAQVWAPVGLAWWADQGLHTATPIITVLFWVIFAPKAPLPWKNAAIWLAWPLIYLAYSLIRGAFTGAYPYHFIDLNVLTTTQFLINSVGLCVAFYLGGLVLIGIAQLFKR